MVSSALKSLDISKYSFFHFIKIEKSRLMLTTNGYCFVIFPPFDLKWLTVNPCIEILLIPSIPFFLNPNHF